jgi:enoyl-CoA hydratase
MDYQTLIVEKKDTVLVVTLNRPERLNALNYQLAMDLESVLGQIEEDGDIRTAIITGAGRGFCAGADIKAMVDPNEKRLPIDKRYTFFSRLEDVPKPVIAAINGPCNGGGFELALCCDFRIASEAASFGFGEVKLGVIPAAGGTVRLPRLIGPGRAREFLYFGNRVDAREAERLGMVNKTVPAAELMEEAEKWAAELALLPPLSLKALKSCVTQGLEMDLNSALDYESRCSEYLLKTDDSKEGMLAFVEKRVPAFKGC